MVKIVPPATPSRPLWSPSAGAMPSLVNPRGWPRSRKIVAISGKWSPPVQRIARFPRNGVDHHGDHAGTNGDNQLWFIAGMVFFLGAHICYIVTFLKAGARVGLAAVGYALILLGALVWLWKPLGAMAIPMTAYGLALGTMATLAAGLRDWRVALGGGLFLLSDLLIAVRVAEEATIPGPPIWVMLTYLAAQFLIATGWVRYRQPRD